MSPVELEFPTDFVIVDWQEVYVTKVDNLKLADVYTHYMWNEVPIDIKNLYCFLWLSA